MHEREHTEAGGCSVAKQMLKLARTRGRSRIVISETTRGGPMIVKMVRISAHEERGTAVLLIEQK